MGFMKMKKLAKPIAAEVVTTTKTAAEEYRRAYEESEAIRKLTWFAIGLVIGKLWR
jgi:hypothetical protein